MPLSRRVCHTLLAVKVAPARIWTGGQSSLISVQACLWRSPCWPSSLTSVHARFAVSLLIVQLGLSQGPDGRSPLLAAELGRSHTCVGSHPCWLPSLA